MAANRRRLERIAAAYALGSGREDLFQEILLQLWRSFPSFEGRAQIDTWIYRVALNTALTYRRRSVRKGRTESEAPPSSEPPGPSDDGSREDAVLHDFLRSLDGISRSLLILHLDGLDHARMAEVSGLTRGAVAVRMHRIKASFRERYL